MGGFVIYLAGASQMTTGPGFQVAIGRWLSRQFELLQQWLAPVPEPVLGLFVAAIAGLFVYATLVDRRRERRPGTGPDAMSAPDVDSADVPCHHATSPEHAVATKHGRTEGN
jgi:hypothetical protein